MKTFLKAAWKYAVVFIWFIASIVFFEYLLNRGNTDLTKEMSKASLPVICARLNGHDFNKMFGYTDDMDYSLIRDGITPLEEGRKLNVRIYKKGERISSVSYELRSIDKERFVEEGVIDNYTQNAEYADVTFAFKDIIVDKSEYSLKIILTLDDGKEAYYYARVYINDELNLLEKMEYVYYFNECTFDKDHAQEEIGKYLESNSSGDNSNFAHVDIHSSLEQVTWGNLDIKRKDEPVCTICEIDSKSAVMKLEYTMDVENGEETRTMLVTENYRFIKGSDRMYLMSFDRYMDTILFADKGVVYNDKLMLGITPSEFEHMESEDGNTYAFVNNGSLFVLNSSQNYFGAVFTFYDKENLDDRCLNNDHDIKIVDVDESGNVSFYVYGYFNRGDHEGKCGIHLFEYNSKNNVVVEKIFVQTDKPYEVLKNDINTMAFANNQNEFYFYFDEKIYKVNTEEQTVETIVENIRKENLFVCDSRSMCAWVSREDKKGTTQITFLRMDTSEKYTIDSIYGEHIKALGFMGEDLIYAEARDEDIYKNQYKELITPMYEINIINKFSEILKKYSQENIYVMGCKINDNLITLTRCEKNEEGTLVSAPPDSIVNSLMEKELKNNTEVIATENLKKIVQVSLKKEMDNKKIKYRSPKTEVYEGRKEIKLTTECNNLFYAFVGDKCLGAYREGTDAINVANEVYGSVIACDGHYIWKKENYRKTNQIMKITDGKSADDDSLYTEICIEAMLEFEGYSLDIKNDLQNGESCEKILEDNIPDIRAFELKNCSPEAIKYYLNNDIPVMLLSDKNSVLIIGYSDSVYVWLNPGSGNVMKMSIDEAESFYDNNGNNFVTYVKWDS